MNSTKKYDKVAHKAQVDYVRKAPIDQEYMGKCVEFTGDFHECNDSHNYFVRETACKHFQVKSDQCLKRIRLHNYKLDSDLAKREQEGDYKRFLEKYKTPTNKQSTQ